MGLGKVTNNLFTHTNLHPTNHKLVSTMLEHLWCQDKPRATPNSQDSPRPELGGSHHLPPYSILCTSPQGPHPNGFLSQDSQRGGPETTRVGTPATLQGYNFVLRPLIGMRSKAKLQISSRAFQRHITRHLHTQNSG